MATGGVFGLNVLMGWEQRRPDWADVAWLAMRVHGQRQRKMGVADVIDVEEDEFPTRKQKGRPEGDTPPPPLFAIFSAELFVFYLGYAMPPDVLDCWLTVSRNDNHWTGCVITHEHHPELAL